MTPCPPGAAPQGVIFCCPSDLQDPEQPNLVPEGPEVHMVQFSISLLDPGYRQLLGEPDSPEYLDLATHLQDQVSPTQLRPVDPFS